MTDSHLDAAAALEVQCFSQPWSRRVLETELLNPNAYFVAALDGEAFLGYAGMHRVLDEGYVANIAVSGECRRRGVATGLLDGLLAFSQAQKLSFLTLEVREHNLPAIAFYTKSGFGEVGRRRDFYANPTEDAILMTRFLYREEAQQ